MFLEVIINRARMCAFRLFERLENARLGVLFEIGDTALSTALGTAAPTTPTSSGACRREAQRHATLPVHRCDRDSKVEALQRVEAGGYLVLLRCLLLGSLSACCG